MKKAIGCLVWLLSSLQAGAEPLVEGRVRLASGEPAAGAQVLLFDLTDLRLAPVAATTDEAGYFALPFGGLRAWMPVLPERFELGHNYPNPFNPSTIIPYQLPASTRVRLEVFNILGQRVTTLVDGERAAGFHTARWDATDAAGRAVAAGVYFYRLKGGGVHLTRRMVLIDGQAGIPSAVPGGPPTAGREEGETSPVLGLAVLGEGLVPYLDPVFRVEAGMAPVDIVVETSGGIRHAKVASGGILGDVDNNGRVDIFDALLVAVYSANASLVMPNNGDITLGDVNGDGRTDLTDAFHIATYTVDPSDPTLPAGIGEALVQATASLSPLPSTVSFQDDGTWHRFTVQAGEPIVVVANPTGTTPRVEITNLSTTNYCPAEANDDLTRQDGQDIVLAGCSSGTGTVELRRASDQTVLQTYTFTIQGQGTGGGGDGNAPDLIVDAPTVTNSSPAAGASFTLRATVRNQGAARSGSTTLRYYRSTDATVSTGDTQVGTDPVSSLSASRTSSESISLRAPSSTGTYYYGACVESVSEESNTGNNCSAAVTVTVGAAPAPDLIVDAPTVSNSSPAAGASFTLRATVRNQGAARSGSTTLRYYRSTDATVSTGDTQVGTDPVSSLSASRTSSESISLRAPSSTGTYYYGACVESVSEESNTGNNCSAAVTVTVGAAPAPDLIVDAPTVSNSSPAAGASFTLRATVRNQGAARSGSTTLRYYRSTDATVSTGDTQVGTDPVSSLSASRTSSESISLRAPSSTGTYYYGACVESVSEESNTGNNCSAAVTVTVGAAPAPDLIVDAPTVSNSSPAAGASFTLRATVRNQGAARSGSTTLRYYRSTDATVSTGDTQVGTDVVSGLSASRTSSESISLRAPSSTGTYYYGACVESVSEESNTGNNCSAAVTVTVGAAPAPDLIVDAPTVSNSSPAAGASFTLRATVRNQGAARSGSTTLRYYRSTDATVSTGDTQVGTDVVSGLSASRTSSESISLRAPSSTGTYYYGACVESVSEESNTGNNCSAAVTVTVGAAPAPDLIVDAPTVSNSSPAAGASFTLRATVRNQGAARSGSTTLRYYRSTDATVSTGDTEVGTDVVSGLSASRTSSESISLSAPSSTGTYYYGACVESVSDESNTGNNCSAAVTVTVGAAPAPDLVVDAPTVTNSSPAAGASFTLRATVRNQGAARSGSTTLRYYRSTDATVSTGDTEVGTDVVSSLSASRTSPESISLSAPSSAGTYYYGACVVSVSGESNTGNNCSAAVTVTVPGTVTQPTPQPGVSKLYWSDWGTDKIQRADLDGSNVEDLVTSAGLDGPDGLSLDLAGGKIYWADAGTNKIQRANLDGSGAEDLVTGLGIPYGLALHVSGGKMYWTNRQSNKIQRANLDGSGVEDLVTSGLTFPGALALDVAGGKMYWTNPGATKIQRANLSGSNVEDLVTSGLSSPTGLALDVAGGKIYWTDRGTDKIQRANLSGSNVEDLVTSGLNSPNGLALDVSGGKIYWTDAGTNKVQRANLNGSGVEDLLTGTDGLIDPSGIAIGGTADTGSGGGGGGGGTSPAPDLVVDAPTVSNSSPTAGASFTLRATVRNQGTGRAGSTTLRYYRSTDATVSTGDTEVGTDPVSTLSASRTSSESIFLSAPSNAGSYYYGACVESVSDESDTGNNCSSAVTVTVGAAPAPDLVVDAPTVSNSSPTAGASFTLRATVRNQGTGRSGSTTLRYYRSTDATVSTGDTQVGTDPVSTLSASRTSSESIFLSAPSNAGSYYYGACVESVSDESDTGNNCSSAVTVTVGAAPAPDLVVDAPTVTNSSPTAGASFTLRATVRNQGTGRSGSTTLRYYRSTDATVSTGDTEVGTDPVSTLSASRTGSESISLRAPSSTGTYYYGACVESVSDETDTGNNCSSPVTVTVGAAPAPDLVVDSPSVTNSSPTAGASFTLSATVRNQGTGGAGSTTLRYYRSTDATVSTGDTQVGTDPVSSLSASRTSSESISLSAPSSTGTYYYGACVESVSDETDTGNNCSSPVTVTVGAAPAPDLVVDSPSVTNSSPTAGASFTLSATVRNQGTGGAGSTTLRYYRSTDATVSTGDTQVGTDPVSSLSASRTSSESISLSAPSTTGTYYYGACVESVSEESNTGNNCSSPVTVTVGAAPAPDLVVDSPSVSTSSPTAGASFTLSATVRNQGTGGAGSTTLRYYRSTDATVSTGDTQVGTDPVSSLSASRTSSESISLSAPSSAGTYYYGACVVSVSGESNTGNNCSSAVTVTVPATVTQPELQPAGASKLYWSDWGTDKIQRADLDGSNVEDLVTSGLDGPDGLAVDAAGGKLYWTDAGTAKIQRADLDGSNVDDLVTSGLGIPYGLALDVSGGKMYWTDRQSSKIQRADLDGSNVEDLLTLAGLAFPAEIAVDAAGGKIYWANPGADKIQRADLDGSNLEDLVTSGLSSPNGVALDVAGGKMYWTDRGTDKIQRADLNGSNVQDLVTSGLSGPNGLDLDAAGGKIYWTDAETDKLQRANLDGSGVEDLLTSSDGLVDPSGLALGAESASGSNGGSSNTYGVGDALPNVPTGSFFPARLSGGGSISSSGGSTVITFNNGSRIELQDGTTYTCIATGGCRVENGRVTMGLFE